MSKMWGDMLIRNFKKSDLDSFLEVASQSFAEEFRIIGFDTDHIREVADHMFKPLGRTFLGLLKLFGKEPFRLIVAETDGRVVGTTMVNSRGKAGYITTVMVHPVHRRKGIATKLMKSALSYTRTRKLNKAILYVGATNTPAKGLYHKLGFKRFENTVYLIADTGSLPKPENVEGVSIRCLEKRDIEAVSDLMKRSEDPTHVKMFGFTKRDLRTPFVKRVVQLSTDVRLVAVKNDKIVGYAQASYTAAREAGRIEKVIVHPRMELEGIEDMLIYEGVKHIKKVGTNKVIVATLLARHELIEKLKQIGFEKLLEMEAMVLEF